MSGNARITDFLLAKIAHDPSTAAGAFDWLDYTPRWTAPEIFRGDATPSKQTDMFSFSMVVVEVGERSVLKISTTLLVNLGLHRECSIP